MPENECQRDSVVSRVVCRLLHQRHRFNASQKSVIALVFLSSLAAICLHWVHIFALVTVYATAVYFTNSQCTTALTRGELYRSELVLSFISTVKDALASFLSLFENDKPSDHGDVHATNTGPSSSHGYIATTSNQSAQHDSSASQEEDGVSQQNDNTVNDEIERFLNLVMRDFVQSWYKTLSPDPDVLEEINEILYQAALEISKHRLSKVNIKKLTCDVIKLYHEHLGTVITCKSLLKSQPKRRRASTAWVSSLEEAFQQKCGFHLALNNQTSEINYVRSLVDIVLVRLLPIQMHRCKIARALVTEVLSCNVILPLMDMTSSSVWIHQAVTEIFGDKSVEISVLDSNGSLREDETFRKQSHSTSSPNKLISSIFTTSVISSFDQSQNAVVAEEEKQLSKTVGRGPDNTNGVTSGAVTNLIKCQNSVSNLEKHFTLTPHEEITISNIPVTESPKTFRRGSIIGAADLAEEAGEMAEERQPPNGMAAQPIFTDNLDIESKTETPQQSPLDIPSSTRQTFSSGSLSPEKPNSLKIIGSDNHDDLSEFKDANSEYSPLLNGFSEHSADSEGFKDCSLPFSLLKPSINVTSCTAVDQSTDSVHSTASYTNQAKLLNAVENRSSNQHVTNNVSQNSFKENIQSSSMDLPGRVETTAEMKRKNWCAEHLQVTGESTQSDPGSVSNSPSKEGLFPASLTTTNSFDKNLSGTGSSNSLRADFYLGNDIEDAEDAESETDIQMYKPKENWANLARSICNYTDSDTDNTPSSSKPEFKVLESKPCLFHSVSITSTDTITDRGASSYTIYKIEFEAWYLSDEQEGEVVLRTGTVLRRFREFVNLQARLEDNFAYKSSLKDVKGPKRWLSLPFGNMDKAAVENRRQSLEKFLKMIIEKELVCNGEEMKEFLAYEGRSHIAFVRKAPELSVPRIDKMFVRTVTGVFGRIATVLPTLTPDVLPSLSRKDSTPSTKLLEETATLDEDTIQLNFGIVQNEFHLSTYEKFMDEYLIRIQQDEMPTNAVLLNGEDQNSGSGRGYGMRDLDSQGHEQVPQRSEGDGSATPDPPPSQGLDERCYSEIPLARAVLDLGARALRAQTTWVCRENIISVVQILLGRALDRWLEDQVTMLTSSEQCCIYLELLRETIWPKGKLATEEERVLSTEEKEERKLQSRKALKEFFPEFLVALIGDEDLEDGIREAIDSVENQKINKHFLYTFLDLVLEQLFPELTNQVNSQRT